ncbi:MAG TPA: hypothetical protein VGI75_15850 [Pirellulales bacterium]|jgi:hypothetical protein
MGILTREQGKTFVISSDHNLSDPPSRKAPRRTDGPYQVWTGSSWSTDLSEAMTFESLDDADDYVRANYARVSK